MKKVKTILKLFYVTMLILFLTGCYGEPPRKQDTSYCEETPIKINLEKEKCVEHIQDDYRQKIKIHGYYYLDYTCGDVYIYNESFYDRYCCIKKEPKTECEKGNEDYKCVLYRVYPKHKLIFGGLSSYLYTPEALEHIKNEPFVDYWECEECREKTDKEKYIDYLNTFDCEKLMLDFTEKCRSYVNDCKTDFYDKDDETLKELFLMKKALGQC